MNIEGDHYYSYNQLCILGKSDVMKKTVILLIFYGILISLHGQTSPSVVNIDGKVISVDGTPVPNAIVAEKGTFNEVETNEEGAFQISLTTQKELLVTAFMKDPKRVKVLDPNTPLTITLTTNSEVLEAVRLKAENAEKKGTIQTQWGEKNKNAVGYGVDRNRERFISPGDVDMYQVLRKIPFVNVQGQFGLDTQPTVGFARAQSINGGPAMILVDGVPTEASVLGAIHPNMVTDISLYRGTASNVRYGSQGFYGVISIKTKNGSDYNPPKRETTALIKGNDYDERVPILSETTTGDSKKYLDPLSSAQTADEALAIYEDLKQRPENRNVPFYINTTRYFSRYGNLYAQQILSDLFEQAKENPRILKTIAFTLEKKKMYKHAIYVLEHTIEKYPSHIQLYRDLAKMYTEVGRYSLATSLYKQMIYNTIPNIDFSPIETIIFNEFRSFISHHKNKIDYKNIPSEFMVANFKKDIRIVLEYTNPQSEFEVQFVSPKKKYFTWWHTYFDNSELIEQEIAQGFALKEFIIEENDFGNWMVNIKQTTQTETATPTYLKYTIYKNYGTPDETQQVKVINLSNQQDKVTLDRFVY